MFFSVVCIVLAVIAFIGAGLFAGEILRYDETGDEGT